MKESNLSRHNTSKHSSYADVKGFERAEKIKQLLKSANRSCITDGHLEQSLRLATTLIEADIYRLARDQQPQSSH